MSNTLQRDLTANPILQNIFHLPMTDLKKALLILNELSTLSDEDLEDVIDMYKTQGEPYTPFREYYARTACS